MAFAFSHWKLHSAAEESADESRKQNNFHCIQSLWVKSNVFLDSKKHHISLLGRIPYEPLWYFYKQLLLLLPVVGWPRLGQPQKYCWELLVPISPTHFPSLPFGSCGKEMRGGQKGDLLIPGIPAHLDLPSNLASVEVKSWADYFQSNPDQAGLLSILCPLFFLTAVLIFLHQGFLKNSGLIQLVGKVFPLLLCHCCSADRSQTLCIIYPLRKFREVQSVFSW